MKIHVARAGSPVRAERMSAGDRAPARQPPGPAMPRPVPSAELVALQRIMQGRPAQARIEGVPVQRVAAPEPKANTTGLPDPLKAGVEALSGVSLDDVEVHYNSQRPAQMQAHAYTQGTEIHVAPGQERHLPHEAWHVVQQKQGRVRATRQLKGVGVNDEPGLEREADVMGARAAGPAREGYRGAEERTSSRAEFFNLRGSGGGTTPIQMTKEEQEKTEQMGPEMNKPTDSSTKMLSSERTFNKKGRWDHMTEKMGLNDAQISSLQVYTSSTYILINGFLREGDHLEDYKKQKITNWLVESSLFTKLRETDSEFNMYLSSLENLSEEGASLEKQWPSAGDALRRVIKNIEDAMKLWPQPEQKVVSRGVGLDKAPEFLKKMHEEGKIASDPGFMSTTFGTPFAKDSIIIINLPPEHPGRNIAEISKFEQEAEILFPPGSGYQIDRILKRGESKHASDFEKAMKELVPNEDERLGRFKLVECIYIGDFVPPKEVSK